MSHRSAAPLLVVGVALAWGLIPLIVKEVELPALALVFFRVALAAVAIAVVLAAGRRSLRLPTPAVVLLGAILAVHWGVYFAAIKETSVASAVLITYTAPVFMALLAPVMIREHVPRSSIVALAVSLVGAAAITLAGEGGDVHGLGVALAVAAAITYALLIVSIKRFAGELDPAPVAAWMYGCAALILSPAAVVADYSLDGADVLYLGALGVVLTGVAGIVYIGALRFVPATTAGILSYMEPVSAAVFAALLIGEDLTVSVVLGGAAIVAAGVLVVLQSREPVSAAIEEPVPVTAGRP